MVSGDDDHCRVHILFLRIGWVNLNVYWGWARIQYCLRPALPCFQYRPHWGRYCRHDREFRPDIQRHVRGGRGHCLEVSESQRCTDHTAGCSPSSPSAFDDARHELDSPVDSLTQQLGTPPSWEYPQMWTGSENSSLQPVHQQPPHTASAQQPVIRSRPERPHRQRQPPPCGISSHLQHPPHQ
ncbi:hypothetical protein PIB30_076021 [Stylosanthes scabra]|uniref:Uncharacterized protein n=1 Tax=Stylosanthes scabra TaxID=79078 RepID=A0ABU6VPN8_9FABA|nr:hypothetical protein [Stylosanthes scabra]